jgi:membrane protease YdiL (CAAX protease family)
MDDFEAEPVKSFADLGTKGKTHWSRYLAGSAVAMLGWILLTTIGTLALMAFGYKPALDILMAKSSWVDLPPEKDHMAMVAAGYVLYTLVALLISTILAARWVHSQGTMSLITAHRRFDFRGFFISGAVFLGLNLILFGGGILFEPEALELVFDANRMWPFFVIVLVLTPFQALAEEVFFRGYLYQGVSATTKIVAFRLIIPALLFTVFHASNGDWSAGGGWAVFVYMTMALYLGWLAIESEGLELSTGLHTANNLFAFTMVTSAGSGMPFATVFFDPNPSYSASAISLVPLLIVHYFIVKRLTRRTEPAPTP